MKKYIALSTILILASCGSDTKTIFEQPSVVRPPDPTPVDTKPVEFVVVTEDNRDEKLNSEPVWYAITTDTYENLAYNFQETLRFIRQQNSIIKYYENITEPLER